MSALKRCPHPHSYTPSATEPTPDNAHFWPPVIPAVYRWCLMAWGKLSFTEKKPWKKFWDPGADLQFHLARSHPIMRSHFPYYYETRILHPAWFLREVYLTKERGICRKPVENEGCNQREWEWTWHVGTWASSEIGPGTTLGFGPMRFHYTWKKVNRASPIPGDQANSLQKWLSQKEIPELKTKSI